MPKKKRVKRTSEKAEIIDVILRYPVNLFASFFIFNLFYTVFAPLTLYPSAFFLQLFYDILIRNNLIFIGKVAIEISKACVAGSAYYLLFMLNLVTRGIRIRRRILIFLFTSSLFLLLNVARIVLLGIMKANNIPFFEVIHLIFWHFVSIIYVFIVWVIAVKFFRIREIPFYSDFIYAKKLIKKKRN